MLADHRKVLFISHCAVALFPMPLQILPHYGAISFSIVRHRPIRLGLRSLRYTFFASLAISCSSACQFEPDTDLSPDIGYAPHQSVKNTASKVAYINPITGELTSQPNPGAAANLDIQQRAQQIAISAPDFAPEYLADGSVRARLGKRFHSPLMATIDCQGNLQTTHQPITRGTPSDQNCNQSE